MLTEILKFCVPIVVRRDLTAPRGMEDLMKIVPTPRLVTKVVSASTLEAFVLSVASTFRTFPILNLQLSVKQVKVLRVAIRTWELPGMDLILPSTHPLRPLSLVRQVPRRLLQHDPPPGLPLENFPVILPVVVP